LTRTPVVAVVVALAVLAPSQGAARGPSTRAERRRAVETTRKLERDPLAKNANADRRWLLDWIVAIPDIQVRSCSGPLDALVEGNAPNGRVLYVQSVFGMAAFLIEHPDREKDWLAVQTAGIESVIRAYQSILRKDKGARVAVLDDLAEERKSGDLRAIVKDEMKDCDPESMGPVPDDSI
jgi:hypothetical protein